jgi:hypothetical protein
VGRLRFAASSWLRFEINRILPVSRRRRVHGLVPSSSVYVPWNRGIANLAQQWAGRLGLRQDSADEADCRHVACAKLAGASYLITHDERFYEALRQHAKLLAPLRPVRLTEWREVIHG